MLFFLPSHAAVGLDSIPQAQTSFFASNGILAL